MTFRPLSRLLSEGRAPADAVAVSDKKTVVQFQEFRAAAAGAMQALAGRRRIALMLSDSCQFAAGLLAVLHSGGEVVLLPNDRESTLKSFSGEFDFVLDDRAFACVHGAELALPPLDADRANVVFFTSGSTGAPKRIAKSLGMLEREAEGHHRYWDADHDKGPVLSTVPHHHLYCLMFKIVWPLCAGWPFLSRTHEFWESLIPDLEPGAIIVSSPAHLERLGGLPKVAKAIQPRRILTAGAPLSLKGALQTEAVFGCLPTEIFGSTETGAFATRMQRNGNEPWTLLPRNEVRTDVEGRMMVRCGHMGDAWLHTGDLIDVLPGGFCHRGRSDSVLKIEGTRISLDEIIQAIRALSVVAAAEVVVLPGARTRLGAAVVLNRPGSEELAEQGRFRFGRLLRQELAKKLDPIAIPRQWRFIKEIPQNPMGKKNHGALAALFGEKER